MRFSKLQGLRVAVWGVGREGRATLMELHRHLPRLALTVLCPEEDAAAVRSAWPDLPVIPGGVDAALLQRFDVVIKSPGIPAYLPAIEAAREGGVRFTSATALWFAENPRARVIGVTGTKGKSTTSALIAHLARALGVRTALAGNIGLPVLELLDRGDDVDLWVLELSSFQTRDADNLECGVITSLYEDHLDWHGSRERYVDDKLALAKASRTLLVPAQQPELLERTSSHPRRILFGGGDGWHVDDDATICRDGQCIVDAGSLPIPGAHNASNACAALTALSVMGFDAVAAAAHLARFQPLPHRQQALGRRDDRYWVNDSISTTPQATLAALRSESSASVTVIVGGHDRGVDWSPFVDAVAGNSGLAVVVQGASGPRIAAALREGMGGVRLEMAQTLTQAVATARAITPADGTILLSPGAPSFDQFHDYAERGRRFAELAGFDTRIAEIEGLGIA